MAGRMPWQATFLKDVFKEVNKHKRQQHLSYANADQITAISHEYSYGECPSRENHAIKT